MEIPSTLKSALIQARPEGAVIAFLSDIDDPTRAVAVVNTHAETVWFECHATSDATWTVIDVSAEEPPFTEGLNAMWLRDDTIPEDDPDVGMLVILASVPEPVDAIIVRWNDLVQEIGVDGGIFLATRWSVAADALADQTIEILEARHHGRPRPPAPPLTTESVREALNSLGVRREFGGPMFKRSRA